MGISWNEISEKSNGGTELIARRLEASMQKLIPATFDKFQIIPSRVRDLAKDKYRVLWVHDLPDDPESKHLANNGWTKFHRIVFVSYWQRQAYMMRYGIPYFKTAVIRNAVPYKFTGQYFGDTIAEKFRIANTEKLSLIYTSTPQRGLDVLVKSFKKLYEEYPDKLHLNVYSSFQIYGWDDRTQDKLLFDEIKAHPGMTYHGVIPNDDLRDVLSHTHIFAYPSTWPETSCMALMEAMQAGCICVHSDLAALPETSAKMTCMYPYTEGFNDHVVAFYTALKNVIERFTDKTYDGTAPELEAIATHAIVHYGWTRAEKEWMDLLETIAATETPEMPASSIQTGQFVYKT
jgi:glycosyltransferase involved in cell wall biosynthesis